MTNDSFSVTDGGTGGQSYDAREIAIHAMRSEGLTLQAIGDTFGITRERVRQILVMSNGPTADDVRVYRASQAHADRVRRQTELVEWLRSHPGSALRQAGKSLGWSDAELATAITRDAHRLSVQARDGQAYQQYTDDKVFGAIRGAWALTRDSADGLSGNRYQELVDSGHVDGPSAARLVQRFGSWSRAVDLASVPAGRTPQRDYSSDWTDGELLAFVVSYLADPDARGTYAGWDQWRRVNAPSAPSGALLRLRMGKWSSIKAMALASSATSPADDGR